MNRILVSILCCCVVFLVSRAWADEEVVALLSPEDMFLEWVNQARANPWAEAERLGFDVAELRVEVGEDVAAAWDAGLPPVHQWNELLDQAASVHVDDMLIRLYYSHLTPEGLGPLERMEAIGYEPRFWGESLGALAFINVIPAEQAAGLIYDGLMTDALRQGLEGAPLLDSLLTDIGIYLGGGQLLLGDTRYNVYVLACELGRIPTPLEDRSELWGHVYEDANGNGRYDVGEGLPGVSVFATGSPIFGFSPMALNRQRTASGLDGSFLLEVVPDNYRLEVAQNGQMLPGSVEVEIDDLALSVRIDLAVTETGLTLQ